MIDIDSEYLDYLRCKKLYDQKRFDFPLQNSSQKLTAKDKDENTYIIDINRKRAILTRCTYQERYSKTIPLLRLDIDTKPHRNPNSKNAISGYHIHVYTEQFETKYAFELDDPILNKINPNFNLDKFNINKDDSDKLYLYFEAFSEFCNIKNIPHYQQMIN